MDAEGKRTALIVATYDYADERLKKLRAPERDAEALASVLGDPEIGNFQVDLSINDPEPVVRRKIGTFFRDRGRQDTLFLHFSGHGVKDEDGNLYLAMQDTDYANLDATAIPSDFVTRQMDRSRSCRIVLTLDCCYSGAFARGMAARADPAMHIGESFGGGGRGRIVLTASNARQYAFEDAEVKGSSNPSIFTSALVEGLSTGEADRDGDSWVDVDELYDYVYARVRERTPNQTPERWGSQEGRLLIARSRAPAVRPEPELPAPEPELPPELEAEIESTDNAMRFAAVYKLELLLRNRKPGRAEAAKQALEALVDDDSRSVSEAAAAALARRGVGAAAEPVEEGALPEPEPPAQPEPPPFWPPPSNWGKPKPEAPTPTPPSGGSKPPFWPPPPGWKPDE
jgi:uncharacterized caspase-like protein